MQQSDILALCLSVCLSVHRSISTTMQLLIRSSHVSFLLLIDVLMAKYFDLLDSNHCAPGSLRDTNIVVVVIAIAIAITAGVKIFNLKTVSIPPCQ